MVRISFKGDLRKAVEQALQNAKEQISATFDSFLPALADNALQDAHATLLDYPVGKFTGQSAASLFAHYRSNKVIGTYTAFRNPIDDKLDYGEWRRIKEPVEGDARSIFGKAEIEYPEAEDAVADMVGNTDWKLKANKSMAIIRTGWPIEYLGLWSETNKEPESYINSLREIMIQRLNGIKGLYKRSSNKSKSSPWL